MRVVRTFHPVGQGAFSVEKIDLCEREAVIVYNCGSTSLDKCKLDRLIKSTFSEGMQIDILFISDFHVEHINGLETLKNHCQINTVILPHLSYEEQIRAKVSHHLDCLELSGLKEYNYRFTNPISPSRLPGDLFECLINDPASFFGKDTHIIQIDPEKDWEPIQVTHHNGGECSLNRGDILPIGRGKSEGLVRELPSGTPVVLRPIRDWVFIPIYHEQKRLIMTFEEALKREGLSFQDIDSIDKIEANEGKLRGAYRASIKGRREGSMFLYSGVVDARSGSYILGAYKDSKPYRCFKDHRYYHRLTEREYKCYLADCQQDPYLKDSELRKNWYYECYRTSVPSGCLYTGNVNLDEDGLVDKIARKLSAFRSALGTVQVPHHGEEENFDPSILELGALCCAVFSFDIHGSKPYAVLREVLLSDLRPCLVTEEPESIEIQYS
mgnify:FL=1